MEIDMMTLSTLKSTTVVVMVALLVASYPAASPFVYAAPDNRCCSPLGYDCCGCVNAVGQFFVQLSAGNVYYKCRDTEATRTCEEDVEDCAPNSMYNIFQFRLGTGCTSLCNTFLGVGAWSKSVSQCFATSENYCEDDPYQ